MGITGGFGTTMDLEHGTSRQWVIGRDGVKRWADNGDPVMQQGAWAEDDLRMAFVAGAAWWEMRSTEGTMWASDRDIAEAEAERRYPNGKTPNAK